MISPYHFSNISNAVARRPQSANTSAPTQRPPGGPLTECHRRTLGHRNTNVGNPHATTTHKPEASYTPLHRLGAAGLAAHEPAGDVDATPAPCHHPTPSQLYRRSGQYHHAAPAPTHATTGGWDRASTPGDDESGRSDDDHDPPAPGRGTGGWGPGGSARSPAGGPESTPGAVDDDVDDAGDGTPLSWAGGERRCREGAVAGGDAAATSGLRPRRDGTDDDAGAAAVAGLRAELERERAVSRGLSRIVAESLDLSERLLEEAATAAVDAGSTGASPSQGAVRSPSAPDGSRGADASPSFASTSNDWSREWGGAPSTAAAPTPAGPATAPEPKADADAAAAPPPPPSSLVATVVTAVWALLRPALERLPPLVLAALRSALARMAPAACHALGTAAARAAGLFQGGSGSSPASTAGRRRAPARSGARIIDPAATAAQAADSNPLAAAASARALAAAAGRAGRAGLSAARPAAEAAARAGNAGLRRLWADPAGRGAVAGGAAVATAQLLVWWVIASRRRSVARSVASAAVSSPPSRRRGLLW